MEGTTNFSRCLQAVRNRNCWVFGNRWRIRCNLKRFDGLSWLSLTIHILRQIYATVTGRAYLAGSEERVEEGAEQSEALVQLERRLVLAEVRRQLHAQRLQLADVTLQLRQLVSGKLDSATSNHSHGRRKRGVCGGSQWHPNYLCGGYWYVYPPKPNT